jgi:hypothetical protein
MSSFFVIGPILSLYRINGSLAVMKPDVGRTPCKRNDSFFENAGKLCESAMMMWIKFRQYLHSRGPVRATANAVPQGQAGRKPEPIGAWAQWKSRATQPATQSAPATAPLARAGRIVTMAASRQDGAAAWLTHAHW